MKIRLNSYRHVYGGIAFWIAAMIVVIVIVVLVLVVASMIAACKRIETFRPKWDDVYMEMFEEAQRIAAAHGGETNFPGLIDIPEIIPMGYGMIIQSTSVTPPSAAAVAAAQSAEVYDAEPHTVSVAGEEVRFLKVDLALLDGWQPVIDTNVPCMFFHKMFVKTNFTEYTEHP